MSFIRGSMILAVSIFLITVSVIIIDSGSSDESTETMFYGYVLDDETGVPIEGVDVYIGNYTYQEEYRNYTDENGYYEIHVSGSKEYIIQAGSSVHYNQYVYRTIESSQQLEQNFSLVKIPYNLQVEIGFGYREPASGIDVLILSADRNETYGVVRTSNEGEFNLTLDPGNYTLIIDIEHYMRFEQIVTVSDQHIARVGYQLAPEPATEYSEFTLVDDTFVVPAQGWIAFELICPQHTSVWKWYQFNNRLDIYNMDEEMYDYFKAKKLGRNLSEFNDQIMEYHYAVIGTQGNGFGSTSQIDWSPAFIVYSNEGDEDITLSLIMKYDYGDVTYEGCEIVKWGNETDVDNDPKDEDDLGYYCLGAGIVILLFIGIWIFIIKRKK